MRDTMGNTLILLFDEARRAQGKQSATAGRMLAVTGDDGVVVRGPGIKEVIARKGTRVNAAKRIEAGALTGLLQWALPRVSGEGQLTLDEMLSWPSLLQAVKRIQPGKGVGCDGFDAYLLKRAPPAVWGVAAVA